jgi:hypothetical protein
MWLAAKYCLSGSRSPTVARHCNTLSGPEMRKWLFSRLGSKQSRRDEILHPRQKSLQFVENLSTSQSEFEAIRRSNQKIILKHLAWCWLAPSKIGDFRTKCLRRVRQMAPLVCADLNLPTLSFSCPDGHSDCH